VKLSVIAPRESGVNILKVGALRLEIRVNGSAFTADGGEVVPLTKPFWWFKENVSNFVKQINLMKDKNGNTDKANR
jgi:hypothetical protein